MGYEEALEGLKKAIEQKQKELEDLQSAANQLSKLANMPLSDFSVSEHSKQEIQAGVGMRGDEYYGKPLATVIAEILDKRNKKGMGPATIKEIYEEMKNGGYRFDAKDEDLAMRGITISMRKNVVKFHRLPSGKFGLTEWYPDLKEKRDEAPPSKTTQQTGPPKKLGRPPKKSVQPETNQEKPEEIVRRHVGRPKKAEQTTNDIGKQE